MRYGNIKIVKKFQREKAMLHHYTESKIGKYPYVKAVTSDSDYQKPTWFRNKGGQVIILSPEHHVWEVKIEINLNWAKCQALEFLCKN